jgi:type IV secretory pathway VirB6-like protein
MPQDGQPEITPLAAPRPVSAGSQQSVPQMVEAAFWLIITSLALSVCVLLVDIVLYALKGSTAATATDVTSSIIGLGLRLLVAFRLRKGANWARGLLSLGAVLNIAVLVMNFSVISLVVVAPVLAAVVLLWLPSSMTFFRETAAERTSGNPGNPPR